MAARSSTLQLEPRKRIILPWDKSSIDNDDRSLLGKILPEVGVIKIGYQSLTAITPAGTTVGHEVGKIAADAGADVFQDWKFKDILATVEAAVKNIVANKSIPTRIITIHATMRIKTIVAALMASVGSTALVAGVSVLTDHEEEDALDIYNRSVEEQVINCADRMNKAVERSGIRAGLVCSPNDLLSLEGDDYGDLIKITPNIRAKDAPPDDQNRNRSMTAAEAIAAGADYLVIGRPIMRAADPVRAAQDIAEQIASAA